MVAKWYDCGQITRRYCSIFFVVMACSGCASLPLPAVKPEAPILHPIQESRLYQASREVTEAFSQKSGFHLLADGKDALAVRLELIELAHSTLDLQYYIWHHDAVGNVLLQRLLAAADRGVRVRLLLDDLDTSGKDDALMMIDAHPNIEIRLFNPFPHRDARWLDFLSSGVRLNHRMHNKSLSADQGAAVLGGRNIGDEYFDASREVGFKDMDVLGVGPVVAELVSSFELYWQSEWSYPLTQIVQQDAPTRQQIERYREQLDQHFEQASKSDYAEAIRHAINVNVSQLTATDFSLGAWALAYDRPEKVVAKKIDIKTHLAPRLKQALDNAEQDLVIVSPYFVPGERFTQYLVDKVKRGVRVRVLTNSLAANDVAMVHAGYRRYREALIDGGVELYELKPLVKGEDSKSKLLSWKGSSRSSLHAKYLGFDRQYLFVGSFNLDGRSVSLNTELGVYFESEKYASQLAETFDEKVQQLAYRLYLQDGDLRWESLADNTSVVFDREPETSWWQRFSTRCLSLVVPEGQL